MTPLAPAKRVSPALSESTLVPLGFVLMVAASFLGMAKWVGTIEARQDADLEMRGLMIEQLKALTTATVRAGEDSAATRAQVQMIVREIDKRK